MKELEPEAPALPEPGPDPTTEPAPAAAPEELSSEPEGPLEPELPPEPAPDIREELGVLTEDLKGTMAGTPGQRIRVLILVVVLGIVMLLAFAAMRASGSGPFADPSAEVAALLL